jgi:hypothetical protein
MTHTYHHTFANGTKAKALRSASNLVTGFEVEWDGPKSRKLFPEYSTVGGRRMFDDFVSKRCEDPGGLGNRLQDGFGRRRHARADARSDVTGTPPGSSQISYGPGPFLPSQADRMPPPGPTACLCLRDAPPRSLAVVYLPAAYGRRGPPSRRRGTGSRQGCQGWKESFSYPRGSGGVASAPNAHANERISKKRAPCHKFARKPQ